MLRKVGASSDHACRGNDDRSCGNFWQRANRRLRLPPPVSNPAMKSRHVCLLWSLRRSRAAPLVTGARGGTTTMPNSTRSRDEFIKGYLAARPLQATPLGFHEYDGRINDYTPARDRRRVSRLRRFDDRLKKFDPDKLSAAQRDRSPHPAGRDQQRAFQDSGHGDLRAQPDDLRQRARRRTFTSSANSRRSRTASAASSRSKTRRRTS